ncbi:MAG: amidohydrolase family protein [Acidobacteriota bacterium]|nr:amidohydrolase family protein [Acidobacteriota bacterium]
MLIRPGLAAGAAALALIVLASLACSTQRSPASPALLIRDVTILSMDDETPRRGSVLVRGDRIEYVGPTPTLPPAPDAHIVEGSGRFLIPGLIDMHTHVSKTRGSSLSLLIAHGVTTVRDLGGDHEELLAWRREIDAGTRIGPRLLIAGPYLESASNAARQHATPASQMVEPSERTRIGVATPTDADRIIAGIAARGVDHLKIRTTTNRETYLAIGAAAKRYGLALTGHVQPYSLDDLLASGQASIEHGFYPPLDEHPGFDRRALFTRLAAAGVAMVPTLVVLERLGTPDDETLKRRVAEAEKTAGGKRLLSAFLLADWREQLVEQGPERRPLYRRLQEHIRRDLREMRAAGVRILPGTDIGVLAVVPGESLHEELRLLVRDANLSPLDALRAATRDAAAFLRRDREIGTIAVGRGADLVLLDADPLADIAHVSRISAVVLRGRLFDRPGLNRLIDEVSGAPDVATNDWPRTPAR